MPVVQSLPPPSVRAVPPSGASLDITSGYQVLEGGDSSHARNHDAAEQERRARLRGLRARIRALEVAPGAALGAALGAGPGAARERRVLPLGVAALDRHLPGGGLPLAGLHEIEGERPEWDDGAATGFCLALLTRLLAAGTRGAVLWAARWRDLYAPGLAAFGLDPGRLILARAGGEADVLWAMEEGLRCADLAAVVGEADTLDRAAGRRLQLAAEAAGRPAFVLRRGLRPARHMARHSGWPSGGGTASRMPSGALSRWRVAPAPSARVVCPAGQDLSGAFTERLPAQARWAVELLRCRGTGPGQWDLDWDDATGGFALATALRDRPLAPPSWPHGWPSGWPRDGSHGWSRGARRAG